MKQNPDYCEEHLVHSRAVELAAEHAASDEALADLAELFKVFGDSTRIRILMALMETELCVCDLAELLQVTQPAVSYQLKILRQAKLVRNRRAGKTIFYSLADDHVRTILDVAKEHMEE